MPEAMKVARGIASCSAPAVAKAKDCVKRGLEVPLTEGLRYEMYAAPCSMHMHALMQAVQLCYLCGQQQSHSLQASRALSHRRRPRLTQARWPQALSTDQAG